MLDENYVNPNARNEMLVTAHDIGRVIKRFNFNPHNFLDPLPAQPGINSPAFKLKGKNYVLALNAKYSYVNFCIDYINNHKNLSEDAGEYEKMVEIWNRNFGEKGSFEEFLIFLLSMVKI
jgi:hypothetical protein